LPAQHAIAAVLSILATALTIQVWRSGYWTGTSSDLTIAPPLNYRVDLNRAERAELLQLPGVGEGLAERIAAYRREFGDFHKVDDLQAIHGVGPATLERLRPLVTVMESSAPDGSPVKPRNFTGKKAPAREIDSKKLLSLAGPIDVNRASLEELQHLPGIGPKLAQRIIDERGKAPFRTVEDLRRVSGIGPKIMERLRPHIVVERPPFPIRGDETKSNRDNRADGGKI
jgi:competence protein ComEA